PLDLDADGVPDYLEDSNGNGLPDWWELYYFGDLSHYGSELDSSTNTLLYDYSNGFDPNVINFTLSTTNHYVNTNFVNIPLNITGGYPSYYAVLTNDENIYDAVWQPYTGSNLLVTLDDDGQYDI